MRGKERKKEGGREGGREKARERETQRQRRKEIVEVRELRAKAQIVRDALAPILANLPDSDTVRITGRARTPEAAAAEAAALQRPKTTRGHGQPMQRPRRPRRLEVQSRQGRTNQPS